MIFLEGKNLVKESKGYPDRGWDAVHRRQLALGSIEICTHWRYFPSVD